MEWRPISEAPKDGTNVLIYGAGTWAVASWESYAVELWGTGWRDMGDIGWGGMSDVEPTAWMPLPPPPDDFVSIERMEME